LYDLKKNLNGARDPDHVELSVLSESIQENLDFDNLNEHLILYLPKAIQLIGRYTYNQYKNIFIAEHDN
jgi:hypothetical protein